MRGVCADPEKDRIKREKLRAARLGKKASPETRERMRAAQKGKQVSSETREKLSELNRGENNPRYGTHHREESKRKSSESNKGKHNPSPETRLKLSLANRGEKCNLWKGGISFEPYCPKFNNEFRERVRSFFSHKCVECGAPQNGVKLHVHHVNFNKKTCCDNSIPLFVALCHSCHSKTGFNREYWQEHFTQIINEQYGGSCYLPKLDTFPGQEIKLIQ